jgi:translation initiation factor IF-1
LDDGTEVRAGLSSQAKRVTVKLLPGDRVRVSLSSYDPSRGRILTKL